MTHLRTWQGGRAVADPPQEVALYRHPRWKFLALAAAIACCLSPAPFQRQHSYR